MAKDDKSSRGGDGQQIEMERLSQRLDMLDQRLDNIDSMVTAVIERIMVQPLTLSVVCPHCGKGIELGIIGSEKIKK